MEWITYLTSLLVRRSLYCSKRARGKHSIAKGFTEMRVTSGLSGSSTPGVAQSAHIAVLRERPLTARRDLKPMPTCLSTPTTSRLAWTELSYGSNFRGRSKNRGYKMSQETCRNCHGTGKCPSCKGRGHHPLYTYKECPDCGGTGRCQECRGYGKVRR